MTARQSFTATEIAAAAKEARENGAVVELHRPDGSKLVVRPQPVQPMDSARARKACPILRGNEPFGAETVEARIDAICGCAGRWDCECVSVFNQALGELWFEHNSGGSIP